MFYTAATKNILLLFINNTQKLCFSVYMYHKDICREKASFEIILLSFVRFRGEVPDNGRKAGTDSIIMWRRVLTNKKLCVTVYVCWLNREVLKAILDTGVV